jgi:proline racemase
MKYAIDVLDTHAGGDVSRIVFGGVEPLKGNTVREKMHYLRDRKDSLRKVLLFEPHGIPEMSVDLLVPSVLPDVASGYIIMEVMGYPIYSGSNTICTATALLELGIVPKREGLVKFAMESPAGLVHVKANVHQNIVESIVCEGLPSYIETYNASIDVPTLGTVEFCIAYSGGFYALVDAKKLGFSLELHEENALKRCAHNIVEAINAQHRFSHYTLGDVGELPFLHFMGEVEEISEGEYRSKSATYVHPGVLCRSTTGTGTSARLALMAHEGKIKPGDTLQTFSLRNTSFTGMFTGAQELGNRTVIQNTIEGKAFVLNKMKLYIDCSDPLIECSALPSMKTYTNLTQ